MEQTGGNDRTFPRKDGDAEQCSGTGACADQASAAGDTGSGATRDTGSSAAGGTGFGIDRGVPHRPGMLLLISGPAGSGKTTLCDRLLAHSERVQRVVTSTSRAPREGERHGVDYYFFSPDEFRRKIDAGDFYEWAQVHGRYYGTLRSEIDDKLNAGVDLLINVDVQGASTFRHIAADPRCPLHGRLVTVFVSLCDLDELRRRLHGRGTDDASEIERRMQTAVKELEQARYYDHVIDSRDRDTDFAALLAVYETERRQRRHGC